MVASSLISFSYAPSLSTSLFSTTTSSPRLLSSQFLGTRNLKLRIRPPDSDPLMDQEPLAGSSLVETALMLRMPESIEYFNYMGMLAVEGTYSKMEALLSLNIHPVDILLILAATEGDRPKIEELLRAGANYSVKDADGRTALERANSEEIRDLILGYTTHWLGVNTQEPSKLCSFALKCLCSLEQTVFFGSADE